MTREEIFALWAPDGSPWSRWVKPVLFAHLDLAAEQIPVPESPERMDWAPPAAAKVALVLDLPGAQTVAMGLALSARGYHPVPLFNAVPMPLGRLSADPIFGSVVAVEVRPILAALKAGATQLAPSNYTVDSPPAFLLDANRRGDERNLKLGDFDNRSISFTSDFPSANFLAAHGIQRALLVQKDRLEPRPDLAHSLLRWQDGGLQLERVQLDLPAGSQPFKVARPPWYGVMFQRVLSRLGFRRAGGGGFGAWVPDSSAGG